MTAVTPGAVSAQCELPPRVSGAFATAVEVASQARVQTALDRLALALSARFQAARPLCLCLSQSGLYLSGMLMQRMVFPLQLGYLGAVDQRDGLQGALTGCLEEGLETLSGRTILLIDGIAHPDQVTPLKAWLTEQGAAEVYVCALAEPSALGQPSADYSALSLSALKEGALPSEDTAMFGCGLGLEGYGRNFPALYRSYHRAAEG